jgi:hypothetical protein
MNLYEMSIFGNNDPKIFTNSDVVSNLIEIEIGQPVIANKLSVSQQTINCLNAKQINIAL